MKFNDKMSERHNNIGIYEEEIDMAIDGVKIIDSDDANDIYHYVTENYKDGVSVDKIIEDMLAEEKNYCIDDFYAEIYWTSLAYSLWKIGHLPDEIKNKALDRIEKGVDSFWLEIDDKALKQRQKVLDKLALQLQSENLRPIKVPKPKTKRTPHFHKGDLLVIKFENEYGICFVSSVEESPRKLEYHLACTRLLQKEKPNIDDFLNSQIACTKRSNSYWLDTDCWFNHRDLGLLLDKFEKIGRVELEDYSLRTLSPASTLEDIYHQITRKKEIWNLQLMETYHLIRNFEIL